MNSQTKILLIVFAVLLLVFLLYNRNSDKENFVSQYDQNQMMSDMDPSYNNLPQNIDDGTMNAMDSMNNPDSYQDHESMNEDMGIAKEDMIKYYPPKDYAPPEADWLQNKFNSKNKARPGEYKRSSYIGGKRGSLGPSDWEDYFQQNNNIIANSQYSHNDRFQPMDESKGGYAAFKSHGKATCGSNQDCEPEDLFDVDKYLPQEVNDDWFEVTPEPISVKNRHLINVTKPIGINTIGTSLKNASWDIRGSPACPKQIVSPWMNSSIEADTNLKSIM